MNIDNILEMLIKLNFEFKVEHTPDFSRVLVPSNNKDCIGVDIIFDIVGRNIIVIDYPTLEEWNEIFS